MSFLRRVIAQEISLPEGIKISHKFVPDDNPEYEQIVIDVFDKGKAIAAAVLSFLKDRSEKMLHAYNLDVDKDYRRQGIASAMYQYAEKVMPGFKVVPCWSQTKRAVEFWQANKKKRKFSSPEYDGLISKRPEKDYD